MRKKKICKRAGMDKEMDSRNTLSTAMGEEKV